MSNKILICLYWSLNFRYCARIAVTLKGDIIYWGTVNITDTHWPWLCNLMEWNNVCYKDLSIKWASKHFTNSHLRLKRLFWKFVFVIYIFISTCLLQHSTFKTLVNLTLDQFFLTVYMPRLFGIKDQNF